jgi:hypothetical protein
VHALATGPTGRTTHDFVRHVGPAAVADRIDGIAVTPLARTVVDVARTETFTNAVTVADAVLAGIRIGPRLVRADRNDLTCQLDSVGIARGTRAARLALDFASPKAESPGESVSRVSIARARLPAPLLQQRFSDREGSMFVDFWWPDIGVIGEFDGVGKYLREPWTGGRSAAEVVIDEKVREDRLRQQRGVSTVVRWGWDVALSVSRLEALLRRAGVR